MRWIVSAARWVWSFRPATFPKESPREKRMPSEAKQAVNRRVLSGMRPTGKLHIGHYVGALQNWTRLQNDYDCFFFVADWHALTTDYADT